jgi:hypothetical protein
MAFRIESEFVNRSISASVLSYNIPDFKKINLELELKKWKDYLDSESETYPTYINSQFHRNKLKTRNLNSGEISDNHIYVIPHYFEEAQFSIDDGHVTKDHIVWLAPILGELIEVKPMTCIVDKHLDEELTFWKITSSDKTPVMINFYRGLKLIYGCEIDSVTKEIMTKMI